MRMTLPLFLELLVSWSADFLLRDQEKGVRPAMFRVECPSMLKVMRRSSLLHPAAMMLLLLLRPAPLHLRRLDLLNQKKIRSRLS